MNYDMGDDYVLFQPAEGVGGAFSKAKEHAPASSIMFYVDVDDIEGYLKEAVNLGGKEIRPKSDIPGIGWFGLFADPDGNVIGLFTPQPHS
jgi:predicted enzyme related to lactoylglutathione lyase